MMTPLWSSSCALPRMCCAIIDDPANSQQLPFSVPRMSDSRKSCTWHGGLDRPGTQAVTAGGVLDGAAEAQSSPASHNRSRAHSATGRPIARTTNGMQKTIPRSRSKSPLPVAARRSMASPERGSSGSGCCYQERVPHYRLAPKRSVEPHRTPPGWLAAASLDSRCRSSFAARSTTHAA